MLCTKLFPTLTGKWLSAPVNFNALAKELLPKEGDNPALSPEWCIEWMKGFYANLKVDYCFGGYMEDRADLWRGHYHMEGRTIHVGVDYNVPAWTPVYLPSKGTLVLLEKCPDQAGGWGGRAIYEMGGLYVMFAHLMHLQGMIDVEYDEKHIVGFVGTPDVNGGWYPHLHVQCMRTYNVAVDGYLAKFDDMEREYPNPEEIF